jgi:hypothetical protein
MTIANVPASPARPSWTNVGHGYPHPLVTEARQSGFRSPGGGHIPDQRAVRSTHQDQKAVIGSTVHVQGGQPTDNRPSGPVG